MSAAYIPKALRLTIAAQARHRCGYCLTQEEIVGTPLDVEHLIPMARGGLTLEENLWLACSLCNKYKGEAVTALDPLTQTVVSLFNPRQQIWAEHFTWDESRTLIIGLTAIGRATISLLDLNRQPLVRARRRWVVVGWHPPKE